MEAPRPSKPRRFPAVPRGVTSILGLVLLVGFVAVSAVALFAVGGLLVDGVQSDLETEYAEQSMVVTADTADEVARGDRSEATWSFDGTGTGAPTVDESAGRINVTQYVDGEPETVVLDDADMGAFRYEREGVEFAYQAGAVWRLEDHGDPILVRPPDIHYTGGTLTLPFTTVTGDVNGGVEHGAVTVSETEQVYPGSEDHANPLRGGTIVIEIESAYCEGWETYFDERTDGALVERCGEADETVDGAVLIELVVPFEFDDAEHSIWSGAIDEGGQPEIENELEQTPDLPEADRLIQSYAERCDGSPTGPIDGTIDEARLHCTDGTVDSDVMFDTATAGGDIEVYVDGTLDLHDVDLEVQGDHDVTFFVGGSVDVRASDVNCAEDDGECDADPSQLRMFVPSGSTVGATNASGTPSEIGALVYAMGSDAELRGTVHFEGTLIASRTEIQGGGGGVSVSYHDRMGTVDVAYDFGGESIYYLHVTETEVEFTDTGPGQSR